LARIIGEGTVLASFSTAQFQPTMAGTQKRVWKMGFLPLFWKNPQVLMARRWALLLIVGTPH